MSLKNEYLSLNDIEKVDPHAFLLSPASKDYLWGGEKLKGFYNKDIKISPLAETWECSTHPNGISTVASGVYKGFGLDNVLEKHPEWLGKSNQGEDGIPVLIKLIDANKDLSVQVHPDDEYAKKTEGELGKIEMWYVLEADPDATLIYGFINDVTKAEIRKSIEDNTIMRHLNSVPISAGDVFFIEPGTIHAIGGGSVIAEIQESSNLTYRVYDYNRKDKDGIQRDLHIEKALDVMNLKATPSVRTQMRVLKYKPGSANELLCRCNYFQVERVLVSEKVSVDVGIDSFKIILCIDGQGIISDDDITLKFKKGDCIFVPAMSGSVELFGKMELLKVKC